MTTRALRATPPTTFGQYSLVSYIHPLRGERINLGVLVWHPILGHDLRFAKSLSRVRCIDEAVDLDRIHDSLQRIEQAMKGWSREDQSPLTALASEFRSGLTVTSPQQARVCSPSGTLERLYTALVSPEPFIRASSTHQFARAFGACIKAALKNEGVRDVRTNFNEEETFQPVRVTAWYSHHGQQNLWRAFSFATMKLEQQLQAAKAIHAENQDLKGLAKYQACRLRVAVQLPKPDARADWPKAASWLRRKADDVEVFEDRQSVDGKVRALVAAE
jgi:hypothetical protein